jgi:hypothetical protein
VLDRNQNLMSAIRPSGFDALAAVAVFSRLRSNAGRRYHACGAGRDLTQDLLVLRTAGMRDLLEINGAWMEECHDVYERCAFADWRRDIGADTVRLHSHEIVA